MVSLRLSSTCHGTCMLSPPRDALDVCTKYKLHCLLADAGKVTATGSGAGQGYTINVPLPGDAGHDSMLAVWQRVTEPAACRFQPDIILCSAGRGLCLWCRPAQ